jgi:hypothetical protein
VTYMIIRTLFLISMKKISLCTLALSLGGSRSEASFPC